MSADPPHGEDRRQVQQRGLARWVPFTGPRRWVVAIAAIGAVVAGTLTFSLPGGSGPLTTSVRNGNVWLQGEITQDACHHLFLDGDQPGVLEPCSITVNGYEVFIVPGNLCFCTPHTVPGLDPSTDQIGSHVDVYAQLIGPHQASILTAAKYYARISG